MEVEFELVTDLATRHSENKVLCHFLLDLRNLWKELKHFMDSSGFRQLHPEGLKLFTVNVRCLIEREWGLLLLTKT